MVPCGRITNKPIKVWQPQRAARSQRPNKIKPRCHITRQVTPLAISTVLHLAPTLPTRCVRTGTLPEACHLKCNIITPSVCESYIGKPIGLCAVAQFTTGMAKRLKHIESGRLLNITPTGLNYMIESKQTQRCKILALEKVHPKCCSFMTSYGSSSQCHTHRIPGLWSRDQFWKSDKWPRGIRGSFIALVVVARHLSALTTWCLHAQRKVSAYSAECST